MPSKNARYLKMSHPDNLNSVRPLMFVLRRLTATHECVNFAFCSKFLFVFVQNFVFRGNCFLR